MENIVNETLISAIPAFILLSALLCAKTTVVKIPV